MKSKLSEIIHELVDIHPYVISEDRDGYNRDECHFCMKDMKDDHDADCIWLRAKQLVENED